MDSADFDVVVVGAGLIGAAAARHLSSERLGVLVLGVDEPTDWRAHDGVFASHYDEGRITRVVDPDPVWAVLARRSMASYGPIEHASGVRFHHRNGGVRVGPQPDGPDSPLVQAERTARQLGAPVRRLSQANMSALFPALSFPDGVVGLWERGGAGYINPRGLVAAQLRIAGRRGVTVRRDTATSIAVRDGCVHVTTDGGQIYVADRVLVAAGAFANLVLDDRLDLRVRAATTLLAELPTAEAARLRIMPTVIAQLPDHPLLQSYYCLPAMPYPDGRRYLKIGGTPLRPTYLPDRRAQVEWFHGRGDPAEGDALREVLADLIPNLRAERYHTRPCVLAYTVHGRPYVDELEPGVFVAVGGNGAAAKSSPEIGRMAARLVANRAWSSDLPSELFAVRRPRNETS